MVGLGGAEFRLPLFDRDVWVPSAAAVGARRRAAHPGAPGEIAAPLADAHRFLQRTDAARRMRAQA
jgi:hypothetical protein